MPRLRWLFWLAGSVLLSHALLALLPALRPMPRIAFVLPVGPHDYAAALASVGNYSKQQPACSYFSRTQVDFVLYYSGNLSASQAASLAARFKASAGDSAGCFRRWRVLEARLTEQEEGYPQGVNNQFYKLFLLPEMRDYTSFFWCEHDTVPVRPYWLDGLYRVATTRTFWVLGSVYKGSRFDRRFKDHVSAQSWLWMPHINGNALWATPAIAPAFAALLQQIHEEKTFANVAFDVALYQKLFSQVDLESWKAMQSYVHLYCYSDFIHNRFGENPNVFVNATWLAANPDTFFAHGHPQSIARASAIERRRQLGRTHQAVGLEQCSPNLLLGADTPPARALPNTTIAWLHMPESGAREAEQYLVDSFDRTRLVRTGYSRSLHAWLNGTVEARQKAEVFSGQSVILLQLRGVLPSLPAFFRRPTSFITMLRDPAERLVAHYSNLQRSRLPEAEPQRFSEFAATLPNMYAHAMGLVTSSNWPVEELRQELTRLFAFIGLAEELDVSMIMVIRVLGMPLPCKTPPRNQVSPVVAAPSLMEVSSALELSPLDNQIYAQAKQIFAEELASFRKRSPLDDFLAERCRPFYLMALWTYAYHICQRRLFPALSATEAVGLDVVVSGAYSIVDSRASVGDTKIYHLRRGEGKPWRELTAQQRSAVTTFAGDILASQLTADIPFLWATPGLRGPMRATAIVWAPADFIWSVFLKTHPNRSEQSCEFYTSVSAPSSGDPQARALWGTAYPMEEENAIPLLEILFSTVIAVPEGGTVDEQLLPPHLQRECRRLLIAKAPRCSVGQQRELQLLHPGDYALYGAAKALALKRRGMRLPER